MSWIAQAVVYQVYPRSFQDASGDGAHAVAVNTSAAPVRMPVDGSVLLSTHLGAGDSGTLAASEARVVG